MTQQPSHGELMDRSRQLRPKRLPSASSKPLESRANAGAASPETYLPKLTPEAQAKLAAREEMFQEVLKFTQENPAAACQLLRLWISAEGTEGR